MAFYYSSSTNTHPHSPIFLFCIIILITLSFLPSPTYSISFNFPDFKQDRQLVNLQGDSFIANGAIEVTKNSADIAINGSVGRATYSEPIKLWDNSTGTRKLTDFNTKFSFIIKVLDNTSSSGYGDGLTFFLAPYGAEIPPLSAGGYLGLISQNVSAGQFPASKIVAVEFDTYPNDWDPDYDHIGININSVKSAVTEPIDGDRKMKGSKGNAWVSYNSTTHNLSVYLTYAEEPVFSGSPIVSQLVDLRTILPENISVGFSAATGLSIELHRVLSWEFNSTLGMEEGKVNTTEGGTPNGPNPSNVPGIHKGGDGGGGSNKSVLVGVAVGIGVIGCVLGFAVFIWLKKKRNSRNSEDDQSIIPSTDDEFDKETGPKRFTYSELAHATNNFDERGKLGEGGFGGVYKGFLSDKSLDIAVKRISSESKQGKKEYQSEVKIISQLRHRNLVQLIGWCHQRNELLLVYEFMKNRSLDKHLFQGENVLTWEVRYKIALGLASALLYLHEEWERCVVHRDVKSSNVMLDSNFNAKLGDFGLARLVDHQVGSQTTVLAGTMGYLAPECVATGKSSKESDVYSFGIVALELACGRKPIDASKGLLLEWVWKLYGSGMVVEAADDRLCKNFDEQQMERLMVLGLCCAHPDHKNRPSMRQAISILNFETPLPVLPSKLPIPEYYGPPVHICRLDSQTDGSQVSCSSCSNTNLSQSTMSSSGSVSKSLLYTG